MKTVTVIFPAIVIGVAFVSLSFSNQHNVDLGWSACDGKELKNDANISTVCWADEDACRIFTMGGPSKKANTLKEKRDTAREMAVLMAQYIFIGEINKKRYELVKKDCPTDCEINYSAVNPPQKAFKNVMIKGVIVEEIFYPDNSCRIIFEIKEKNLKKRVSDYLKAYDTP